MEIYVITCFISSDKDVTYFIFDNENSFDDYIAWVVNDDTCFDEDPKQDFEVANNLREFTSMTKDKTIVREAIYNVVDVSIMEV